MGITTIEQLKRERGREGERERENILSSAVIDTYPCTTLLQAFARHYQRKYKVDAKAQ